MADEEIINEVTEGQPGKHKPSKYTYVGKHEDGSHIFNNEDGKPEKFMRHPKGQSHASWGLYHKGHHYEFKSSNESMNEDHNHSDTELSDAARELVLHGDNTQHLYHTSAVPIRKNLNKKIAKGVYDHDKATKLWGYHADKAAQSYTREHGHPGVKWHEMFKPKDRRAAAKHWADEHHESIMSGSLDHVHEDTSASDIVFAALESKPVDLNTTFHAAVLERSQFVVREMKDALAQTVFAEKETK